MAKFKDKINFGTGFVLCDPDNYFIYRSDSMRMFARKIYDDLYLLTNPYRLFIQYKTTHRVKRIAGHCFLWDNSHGDHMADPGNGIELRSLNDASQDDCEGFCCPRFDAVESAIFITDRCVIAYGDVQIEADSIRKDKKHVICTASLRGYIVSFFKIPAETFDRCFGLKENFPDQCAKPDQEENDLIEEAKRNIELCKDSLCSTKQMIERLIDLTKCALIDIEDREFELGDMLSKLTQKEERREEKWK